MKKIKLLSNKVNYNNLALISENIATLYNEGISMITIMDLLVELPLNKYYKESILNFKEYIKEGRTLEECFRDYSNLYPDFFSGMISIGEKSGNLYKVLKGLEMYCNKIVFIKNTIKNAISYPIFLLITVICLFAFIVLFTIPILYDFFIGLGTEIPYVCQLSYNLSNYIKANPFLSLIYMLNFGAILPYLIYKYYLKNFLKIVFNKISIYKDFIEYIFILLLAIIYKSGVNLSEGLVYATKSFNSSDIKERFIYINSSILDGYDISNAMKNSGSYSKYTISMVKLGEEGGSIDERLTSLSQYLEKNLLAKIERGMALLQPASIILMGGLVVIFLLVFIMPLFTAMFEVGF